MAYFSVLTKCLAAEDKKHNKTTLSGHSAPKPRLELGTSPVLQLALCVHALAHDVTVMGSNKHICMIVAVMAEL